MRFLLGLTGSIGMGKTTAAQIFKQRGCAVWDADLAVADIYENNPQAIRAIARLCPDAHKDGRIDKQTLRDWVQQDENALKKLEQIVHPHLKAHKDAFKRRHTTGILVFDIPLLFETQAEAEYDSIACVLTDENTQRKRVLSRPNMNEGYFEMIKTQQMPAKEKAKRADFVIPTDTLAQTQQAIDKIIEKIEKHA